MLGPDKAAGSLWEATATETADFPRLEGALTAQVVVVGAGYAGLSASIALADRGVDVVVVDTHQPGWGASGRNGGIVVPAMKIGPEKMVEQFGMEHGLRLHEFGGAGPDRVFEMVDRFGIDCDAVRNGWLVPAHSNRAAQRLRRRVEEQQHYGDPVEFLEAEPMAAALGCSSYHGGLFDPRGGQLQPLSYARGLARGAGRLGVRVFADSEVIRLDRLASSWTVASAGGSISADHVIVATNGYTGDLTPKLRRSMIAVHSLLVATEPLGDIGILANDQAVSDSRRVLGYFRKDRDGRLAFGGRGKLGEPRSVESYMRIMKGARDIYPQLMGARFEFHWGGRVAVNRPHLPQINRPVPAMTAIVGFNGRGVAFATAIGLAVAGIAMGDDPQDVSPLPVTRMPVIPMHGLESVYSAVGTKYYQLRDRFE